MEEVTRIRFLTLFLLAIPAFAQSAAVQKVQRLMVDLSDAESTKRKVRFQLTEAEVNEYLQYARTINPRPGLDRLTVRFFPGNYISTLTIIDFDMVERQRPGTIPALLRPVLSGKKELWLDLRLAAADGVGSFSVEKAYLQSIRLPALLVEAMLGVVGASQKEQFDTNKPVPLPFGLRRVATGDKSVTGEN